MTAFAEALTALLNISLLHTAATPVGIFVFVLCVGTSSTVSGFAEEFVPFGDAVAPTAAGGDIIVRSNYDGNK